MFLGIFGLVGDVVGGIFKKNRQNDSQEFQERQSEKDFERAKEMARMQVDINAQDRANAYQYRAKEMTKKGEIETGLIGTRGEEERALEDVRQTGAIRQIETRGGIEKDIENTRQEATTERLAKEIASRELMQERGFDFQLDKQARERAAALNAGKAGY